MKNKFQQSTIEKIGYYVYALKNPINKKVFYVGKWKWNRIFQHIHGTLKNSSEKGEKIETIKKILEKWKEIEHYIIRHWLTEKEAYEVEASIIDFCWFDKLTNKVLWHNTIERGIMNIQEIQINYEAKKANITIPVILININKNFYFWISQDELYEAARKSWKVSLKQVNKCKYALSVYKWIVRWVFEITKWKPILNGDNTWRYQFIWKIAEDKILNKYLFTDVSVYWWKWSQNPIKYVNT